MAARLRWVAGLALSLTAGAATTLFTRNPEQASITTLPGMMVLLVAPVAAVPVALLEGPYWQYLLLLPGVGVGHCSAGTRGPDAGPASAPSDVLGRA